MLYLLASKAGRFSELSPLSFSDFSTHGLREKDLEDLLGSSLYETLFEEAALMPIFQERSYQPEADLYALNAQGELVIFELKRGPAGEEAVTQALRYAQKAGQWTFDELERRFQQYGNNAAGLVSAHREAFNLDQPLLAREFNCRQQLYIIGSAADDPLRDAVVYWQRQGVAIEFLPYRLYEIGGQHYFEFFSPPFDQHRNPADRKGVIFDTNRTWDEDAIWYMVENSCVAAFGDAVMFIDRLSPGDTVFLSHKSVGLVAAARVKNSPARSADDETRYREVEFLTPLPTRGKPLNAMPFWRVSEVTGRRFYWARTIKVPYLDNQESEALLAALMEALQPPDSPTEAS